MRQGVNVEHSFIVFRSTIAQLYTLCGGTRLLTDDIDDLAIACEHIRAWPPSSTRPDLLAEARQALENAVADIYAALARYGWTASALPGGSLEQLERLNDEWKVLRLNANPATVVGALEALQGAKKSARARLRNLAETAHQSRLLMWGAKVAVPILLDSGNRNSERCSETAARMRGSATGAAMVGLGLIEAHRSSDVDLLVTIVGSHTYHDANAVTAPAADAEWARFADFVADDLRSDDPQLRVLVNCPLCHAQAHWHPREGMAAHECAAPRPGAYETILGAALPPSHR
jgi:hypothetical protein